MGQPRCNCSVRALVEDVIEVQQAEIEYLRRWLAEHPQE